MPHFKDKTEELLYWQRSVSEAKREIRDWQLRLANSEQHLASLSAAQREYMSQCQANAIRKAIGIDASKNTIQDNALYEQAVAETARLFAHERTHPKED